MIRRSFAILCGAVVLTGCASVSVTGDKVDASLAPKTMPKVMYVRNFAVKKGAEFDVILSEKDGSAEKRVADYVSGEVIKNSQALGLATTTSPQKPEVLKKGLLVDGEFTQVRQGSRGLRFLIGLGAGRSRMETTVRVYNLEKSAQKPWLTFETTGGSNMEPGLIGVLIPSPVSLPVTVALVGGAVTAAASGTKGVSFDGRRTGKEIAANIHENLAGDGLVTREIRVKKKGKLNTPFGRVGFGALSEKSATNKSKDTAASGTSQKTKSAGKSKQQSKPKTLNPKAKEQKKSA